MRKIYIIAVVMIAVVALVFLIKGERKMGQEIKPEEQEQSQREEIQNSEKEVDKDGWQTYRNEEYGFELRYPEDWRLEIKSSKPENNSKDSFYFIKSRTREEKVYFSVLTNGGFGYGVPELRVTHGDFKGKKAKISWYGQSDVPTFVSIEENFPNNWSKENAIEIVNWNKSEENSTLLKEIYESFKFL